MDFSSSTAPNGGENEFKAPVTLIGLVLIGAGLVVLWNLTWEIIAMYGDPMGNHFISSIAKSMAGAKLTIEKQSISINEQAALGAAIIFFFMLAGLGVSIATLLIRFGAQLLSPQILKDLAAIRRRLESAKPGGGNSYSGG